MSKMTNKFSPEVRLRAVRLVLDHNHEHTSRCPRASSPPSPGPRLSLPRVGDGRFLSSQLALAFDNRLVRSGSLAMYERPNLLLRAVWLLLVGLASAALTRLVLVAV